MKAISFGSQTYTVGEGETVLDKLLEQGEDLSYGCKSGVCQSCVLVCEQGEVPLVAQKGLKESHKALNYFMACQCKPETDMTVSIPKVNDHCSEAKVIEKRWLNDQVLLLRLQTDESFKAGQFFTLWKDETVGRSYSVASASSSGDLEFHIKVLPDGKFSQWAATELKEGDCINISGPLGDCIYASPSEARLLLAGIGTGLAPLLGIVRDAFAHGHEGQIDLFVGAKEPQSLYLLNELEELVKQNANLSVNALYSSDVQSGDLPDFVRQADIYSFVKELHPDLKGSHVYLCGAESFVKKMKKQCFLSGANMGDISADAFVSA